MNIHTSRTTSHLPTLLHTLQLPASISLGLALHVILVKRVTPIPDEIRCAQQRRGRRSDLVDFGDVSRHRGRVHQDTLVEAVKAHLVLALKLGLWTLDCAVGLGWELVEPGDKRAIGHTEDLSGPF